MNFSNSNPIRRRPLLVALAAAIASGRQLLAAAVTPQHKVSLRDAHKGTLEIDTLLLDSYGAPADDLRQFYLDARALFEADREADFSDSNIVEAARSHGLDLMGGPMLGDVRPDGVTVWLRPAIAAPVSITVGDRTYESPPTKPGQSTRIRLDRLAPNTDYSFSVRCGDREIASGRFTTAPAPQDSATCRIAFGSCCHKIGVHNPNLFGQIRDRKPHAMLLLGDIAVDDRNNLVNMHRSDYQLRDVSTAWRDFVANVPVCAAWDDHDYFDNDLSGIPKRFGKRDREAVRGVWSQNWNNPPTEDGHEGIYFNTRIGPTEVIMLDTRSCRENARRNRHGAYLGKRQLEWLKRTLKESTAPFKVISSGTMWSDYVSNAKDSWGSWDKEAREEVFELIEQEDVSGVLLVSGDRHGARGFRIPRPSGYSLYEFEPATLGGVSGPKGIVDGCPEQLFGYDGLDLVAFGEFTFEMAGAEPRVTFRLINQSGAIMEQHELSLTQLTPSTFVSR